MRNILLAVSSVLALVACTGVPVREDGAIEDRVLHRIDSRLFGHFLERLGWGETGVEGAALPGTQQLDPRVTAGLRELRAQVLRFTNGGSQRDIGAIVRPHAVAGERENGQSWGAVQAASD